MHYTPNGTATEDSTRLGLIFAKQPPRHEVEVRGIVNPRFEIPAGAKRHAVTAQLDVPNHVQVLGFLPHMHLRGVAARYELLRDGQVETLLDVPQYDFNWQLCYRLARPRAMQPGDTIRYTSWYDNSAENPANPDPTRSVRWGEQTYDEMHLGYVEYIVEGENPDDHKAASPPAAKDASGRASAKREGLFRRLDVDGDGFITREEVRQRLPNDGPAATTTFDRLDGDRDGKIDRQELSRL